MLLHNTSTLVWLLGACFIYIGKVRNFCSTWLEQFTKHTLSDFNTNERHVEDGMYLSATVVVAEIDTPALLEIQLENKLHRLYSFCISDDCKKDFP